MIGSLMDQPRPPLLLVVLVGLIVAVTGCEGRNRRTLKPVYKLVSTRDALRGYRVPEYTPRRAIVPPERTPPPTRRRDPDPKPDPHPEWVAADPRAWRYIVIHHSHTDRGNAAIFGRYHLNVRGWENGLGYHFVIGNGTDSGDGEVEVGPRWTKQLQGAHAGVWLYNQFGIGVCLVGDFEKTKPTEKQIKALLELVGYLQAAYKIPQENILRHGDVKNTKCPGKNFPFEALFRKRADERRG